MSGVIYSAVVLDESSRNKIINRFRSVIPNDWEIIAHHMTINLGEISDEYEKYLGMSVRLMVNDIAMNDKVIAVGVDGFFSKNSKPHITLAVNRKNNGSPKLSNKLVNWKPIKRPFGVVGRVTEVKFN